MVCVACESPGCEAEGPGRPREVTDGEHDHFTIGLASAAALHVGFVERHEGRMVRTYCPAHAQERSGALARLGGLAEPNPHMVPWRRADLLWRGECAAIALRHGVAGARTMGKTSLTRALALLAPDVLQREVAGVLRRRANWRTDDGRSLRGAEIRAGVKHWKRTKPTQGEKPPSVRNRPIARGQLPLGGVV